MAAVDGAIELVKDKKKIKNDEVKSAVDIAMERDLDDLSNETRDVKEEQAKGSLKRLGKVLERIGQPKKDKVLERMPQSKKVAERRQKRLNKKSTKQPQKGKKKRS